MTQRTVVSNMWLVFWSMVIISSWSPSNELLKLNRGPKTRNKKETSRWIPIGHLDFEWVELSCVKLVGMVTDRLSMFISTLFFGFGRLWANFRAGHHRMDFFDFDGHPNSKQEKWQIMKYPLVTISSWKPLMCESCNMKVANSKWWQTFLTNVWIVSGRWWSFQADHRRRSFFKFGRDQLADGHPNTKLRVSRLETNC